MTSSFTNDKFASLPMADLQGSVSMHYHAKEEHDIVLKERAICEGELARLGRALDTLGDLSLPFMAGSSRSASAVRDARSGSVISNIRSGVQSRSTSVANNNNNDTNTSNVSAQQNNNTSTHQMATSERSESVRLCAHQIKDAVDIVTNLPKDDKFLATSKLDKKKSSPLKWDIESKVKALTSNEDFASILKSRKSDKQSNNDQIKRPTFRKLAPAWNRHQHQKHKDQSAKTFKSANNSLYHCQEDGTVESFQTDKMRESAEESRKRQELAMEQVNNSTVFAMHFGTAAFAEAAIKAHDAQRKEALATEREHRQNSPQRGKGEKREWKFQVPSLLNRSKSGAIKEEESNNAEE